MFIFGWGSRPMLVDSGIFPCPVCKVNTNYIHLRHRRWMTFFFIPVIPLSKSYETVACQKCQSSIPIEAVEGKTQPQAISSRVPLSAMFAMIGSIFALLTFCIYSMSFGLALVSVILAHKALKEIKRDRPAYEGRWQAITALAIGYPAMLLAIIVGLNAMMQKKRSPRDVSAAIPSSVEKEEESTTKGFGISESSNEAFKNAEYEIASKRDKPAGRGNSPEAIELANTFAARMKDISDEAFTSNRKPLLQLSDGEFLTYCQLHEDRCLFLVHVPSYRNFNKVAKKTLAEFAWLVAQSTTAGKLKKQSKLGVALRGVLSYGAIMLGDVPTSSEDKVQSYTDGKKDDLMVFFESSLPSTIAKIDPSQASNDNPFEPIETIEQAQQPNSPTDLVQSIEPVTTSIASPPARKEPEATRPRKKATSEPEFVNQIAIELVRTIKNDSWGTTSIASSPDGKWLALGKQDEKVLLYNAENGHLVARLDQLKDFGQVTCLAFSHDSAFLIAGGYSGQLLYWQVSSDGRLSEQRKGFRFESPIEQLVASPKFPFFMGTGRKGTIAWQPFESTTPQPRILQEYSKGPLAIWLPSEGDQAKATDGRQLVSFSLRNAEVAGMRPIEFKGARYACFSTSGNRLVLADGNTLSLTDLGQNNDDRKVRLPPGQTAHALEFHPNQSWVAVGMRGRVGILDFDRGDWVAHVSIDTNQYMSNIRFSSDGRFLFATSRTAQESTRIYRLGGPENRDTR